MAETLTMEPNVEKTSIDNLSAEEQDSLQVGEKMEQAQEQLLAGKYKNAEELEKGYLELQQKLNTKEESVQEEQAEEELIEEPAEEDKEQRGITEKDLAEKSQSFRDSQKYRKKKAKK